MSEKIKVFLVYTQSELGGVIQRFTFAIAEDGRVLQKEHDDELLLLHNPPFSWMAKFVELFGEDGFELDRSYRTMGELLKARPDIREKNHA